MPLRQASAIFRERARPYVTGDGQVSKAPRAREPWHTAQSAALPYRWSAGGPQILLVTSRATRRWVVPKGSIKSGMSSSASAALEAYEEAGVHGRIMRTPVGRYAYSKKNGRRGQLCLVQVFPLRVQRILRDWPERRQRRREWTTFAIARERVHEAALKRILLRFEARLLHCADGEGKRPQVSRRSPLCGGLR